jgi:hypothetical protein
MVGTLAAAGMMAAAVGTASATRLSTSSQGIRAAWTNVEFIASGINVRCPVTIEGTLHSSTISKVSGILLGYVTRAIFGEASCANGRARTLPESLPWHIQYLGFNAAAGLPEIEKVNVAVLGGTWLALVNILGSNVSCLYRTTAAEPATVSLNRVLATRALSRA